MDNPSGGGDPGNGPPSAATGQALGEAIVECRRFLRRVHTQVAALLGSLDGLMSQRGWTPTNPRQVALWPSSGLDAGGWLVDCLYRYYFPPGNARDRVVGVFIYLELPEVGDYTAPVCLVFAARFGTPQEPRTIDDGWETDDVMGALVDCRSPRPLTREEYGGFLPQATAVAGAVIPLCEVTCEDDLLTRIIDPLLNAQQALGTTA